MSECGHQQLDKTRKVTYELSPPTYYEHFPPFMEVSRVNIMTVRDLVTHCDSFVKTAQEINNVISPWLKIYGNMILRQ